jgi:hypothetical protein
MCVHTEVRLILPRTKTKRPDSIRIASFAPHIFSGVLQSKKAHLERSL